MEFSYFTRKKDLKEIEGREFDVLVVGCGIAGAGIASILSTNQLKVLLIDKADFASGTSSNSSKLIHGGLRYLGQGHVLLTWELLRERNYLLNHLDFVRRLRFDILVDESSWSKGSLYLGLFLYNLLGGTPTLPRFRRDGYSYPGYKGRFTYEDASTDDALLVIHNVVSSVMQGATAINYLEAVEFQETPDGIRTTLIDRFEDGKYSVRSKVVVNASGPWVNEIYGLYASNRIDNLRLSKGSHLIVRKEKFHSENAVAFRSHLDRRQMFIIPKGEVVIVGTTDRFIESPESWEIDEDESEYILESLKRLVPSISREDVIGSYSGIRPLYGKGDDPGRVTRDFHVDVSGRMLTIMGVKITNYRSASRKISRRVGKMLGIKLNVRGLPKIIYRRGGEDLLTAAINNECALTADDVLRRRLGVYYSTIDQGRSMRKEIEERLGSYLRRNDG